MASLNGVAPRIGRLIPRLATDHDGEIVATARAIRRTLEGAGLDLYDLVNALDGSAVGQSDGDRYAHIDWIEPETIADAVEVALRYKHYFNDWERGFVEDLDGRDTLTPRQAEIVKSLIDRARGIAFRPADGQAWTDG